MVYDVCPFIFLIAKEGLKLKRLQFLLFPLKLTNYNLLKQGFNKFGALQRGFNRQSGFSG